MGSYRRGRPQCGDVDVLVTVGDGNAVNQKQELQQIQGILPKLVAELERTNFLIERLGADRIAKTGSQTYMGICQVSKSSTSRRIDLKVYPRSQYGYALLYFTGSAQFNKNMRTQAVQYGYSMSDAAIYKVAGSKASNLDPKIEKSLKALLNAKTSPSEREIIEAFGMKYVAPAERDI